MRPDGRGRSQRKAEYFKSCGPYRIAVASCRVPSECSLNGFDNWLQRSR